MRFTDRSIAALKPKYERYEIWEEGRTGLGVRVGPTGRRSWIYMYRFEGKPRRMTFGIYPKVSLADARVLHAKARKQKDNGADPGIAHVDRRRAERNAETVAELINEYLEKYARPNKRTADADERALRKEVETIWGRRKAKSITRRDVVIMLDDIVDRGSPIMANRLLEMLRRMFAFAVERDILDTSPCVMIKPPAKETARDRVLTPTEIQEFWVGLEKAEMTKLTRLALKFMLSTAQRREEIVGAFRAEFDLDGRVWEIPGTRTKSGNSHRVPLSDLALDLLKEIFKTGDDKHGDSEWLFPSTLSDGAMTPSAITHAVYRCFITNPPPSARDRRANPTQHIVWPNVGRFTPHDLRRTAASHMTEIGILRLIVSKILGHSDSSVTAVYDRFDYWPEKTAALNAWASRLQEIVSGKLKRDNILSLPAGGKSRRGHG